MMCGYVYDTYIAKRTELTKNDTVFFANELASIIKQVMRIMNGYHKMMNDVFYCPDTFPVWDDATIREFYINTSSKDKNADFAKSLDQLDLITKFNIFHTLFKPADKTGTVEAPVGAANDPSQTNSVFAKDANDTADAIDNKVDPDDVKVDIPSDDIEKPSIEPTNRSNMIESMLDKIRATYNIKQPVSDGNTVNVIEIDNSFMPSGMIHPYLPVTDSYFSEFQSIKNHILFFSMFLDILVEKYNKLAKEAEPYSIYKATSADDDKVNQIESSKLIKYVNKIVEVSDSMKMASKSYQVAIRLAEQTVNPLVLLGKGTSVLATGAYSAISSASTGAYNMFRKRKGGKRTRGPKHRRGQGRGRHTRKRPLKGGLALYSSFKSVLYKIYHYGEGPPRLTASFVYPDYIKSLSDALHKKVMMTIYFDTIVKTFLENIFRFDIDLEKNGQPVSDEDDLLNQEITDATNYIGEQIQEEIEYVKDILLLIYNVDMTYIRDGVIYKSAVSVEKTPEEVNLIYKIKRIDYVIVEVNNIKSNDSTRYAKLKKMFYSFKRRSDEIGFVDLLYSAEVLTDRSVLNIIDDYTIPTADTGKTQRQNIFAHSVSLELAELKKKNERFLAELGKAKAIKDAESIIEQIDNEITTQMKPIIDNDIQLYKQTQQKNANDQKNEYIRDVLLKDKRYSFIKNAKKLPDDLESFITDSDKERANRYYYSVLRKALHTTTKMFTMTTAQKENKEIPPPILAVVNQYKENKIKLFNTKLTDYMKEKDKSDQAKAKNADVDISKIINEYDQIELTEISVDKGDFISIIQSTPTQNKQPELSIDTAFDMYGKEMETVLINIYKQHLYEGILKDEPGVIKQANLKAAEALSNPSIHQNVEADVVVDAQCQAKIDVLEKQIHELQDENQNLKKQSNQIVANSDDKSDDKQIIDTPNAMPQTNYTAEESFKMLAAKIKYYESISNKRVSDVSNDIKRISDSSKYDSGKNVMDETTIREVIIRQYITNYYNMYSINPNLPIITAFIDKYKNKAQSDKNTAQSGGMFLHNTLNTIKDEFYKACVDNYIAQLPSPINIKSIDYLAELQKFANASDRLKNLLALCSKRISAIKQSFVNKNKYTTIKNALNSRYSTPFDYYRFLAYYAELNMKKHRNEYISALEIQISMYKKFSKKSRRLIKSLTIQLGITARFIAHNGPLAGLVVLLTAASWASSWLPLAGPISLGIGFALGQVRNLVLILGAPFMEQPENVFTRKDQILETCKSLMPYTNPVSSDTRKYNFVEDITMNSYPVLEFVNYKFNFGLKLSRNLEGVNPENFMVHSLKRVFVALIDSDLIDFDTPAQKKLAKADIYRIKNLKEDGNFREDTEVQKEITTIIGDIKYEDAEKKMEMYMRTNGLFSGQKATTFSMGIMFGVGGFGVYGIAAEAINATLTNLLLNADLQKQYKHPPNVSKIQVPKKKV